MPPAVYDDTQNEEDNETDVLLRRRGIGGKVFIKSVAWNFTLKLKLSETIPAVKVMIQKMTGILPRQQVLMFDGEKLDRNDRTLADYGVLNGSTLVLDEIAVIKVLTSDQGAWTTFLTLNVGLLETIARVKSMIHNRKGIPVLQQALVFAGKILDEEDRTLADCGLSNDSNLYLLVVRHLRLHELKDKQELLKTEQTVGPSTVANGEDQDRIGDEGSNSQDSQREHPNEVVPNRSGQHDSGLAHNGGHAQVSQAQVVHCIGTSSDQVEEQKRWSNYSHKVSLFAITMFFTYLSSISASFSIESMPFLMAIGIFFINDVALVMLMPPQWGIALIYLSWFLMAFVACLLLVAFNKYYGYAIFSVPLPFIAAFLHDYLRQKPADDHYVDLEIGDQNHSNDEKDNNNLLDYIFDSSSGIVNAGGMTAVIFGHNMVGPTNAVGFCFFFTVTLGLYLMMVTTVRSEVFTRHARILSILLKFLVAGTLIATWIHMLAAKGNY